MNEVDQWGMKAAQDFIADQAEHISMPEIYRDIRRLIEQQDSDINAFVKLIENDSALSTRLLRIANSHYFGYPKRADDLYQAVSLVGIMQLHDLVLNSLSFRTLAALPAQIFNLEAFWRYSVECGIAARTLAQFAQIIPINPFFTLGLMHEIGHAVMFVKEPELSLQAIDETKSAQKDSITNIERDLLGFDYTQAGSVLMKLWHLPELYQQVTAHHLYPERADEPHQQAVNIVHLAHMLCQNRSIESKQQHIEQIKKADPQIAKLPDNIAEIVFKEIEANTDTVLNMLWLNCAQELAYKNQWQINE